jgi:hypothetical protein
VLAFADIIDFLLTLLGDEAARAEFDEDPQGTLARAGLEGVTAQDIRDARLELADSGAVHPKDHATPSHGSDAAHEIGYTTEHYVADEAAHSIVENNTTLLTIDDRDTLFFQSISDDDVTINDDSVSIADSFNRDDSQVTAIQADGSFNSDDDTLISAVDSFNSDDDVVAIQDNDVDGGDEDITVDTSPGTDDDPAALTEVDAPGPEPADAAGPESEAGLDEPTDAEDEPADDLPAG